MLFHITGPSGSGKTTLGNKLSKIPNTVIIDTDEIDDTNAMDIITDPKYNDLFKNENTVNQFFKLLEQRNSEKLGKLLEKNKGSNIIIVGMTIYPPVETGVQGYSIDISADANYYQLNNRTLDTICSNCVELKDLLEKEPSKYKVDLTMLFKYKIRFQFPIIPFQVEDGIKMRKDHALELGYKYLSQEKIVEDIINILEKANNNKSKSKLTDDNSGSETDKPIVKTGLMRYKKPSKSKISKISKNQ
jgi:hypothetical protein